MKLLKFMVLLIIVAVANSSCSSDDEYDTFEYGLKRTIGKKVKAFSQENPSTLYTDIVKLFAIDTLEIDLNANPNIKLAVRLSVVEFGPGIFNIVHDENIKSHVNYINFINLKSNWDDNVYKKIFLRNFYLEGTDQPIDPFKGLTYSESNINLSNHPNLFIDEGTNENVTIEVAPKVGDDILLFKSSAGYTWSIGDEIPYEGHTYTVVSKVRL